MLVLELLVLELLLHRPPVPVAHLVPGSSCHCDARLYQLEDRSSKLSSSSSCWWLSAKTGGVRTLGFSRRQPPRARSPSPPVYLPRPLKLPRPDLPPSVPPYEASS